MATDPRPHPDLDRAEEIFDAAMGLAPEERPAYVAATCGDDATMRDYVLRLLATHPEVPSPTDVRPWLADPLTGSDSPEAPATAHRSGETIGRYKLLEQIGEGGFGTIWMAEQREPMRRRVALKIIKPGMDTREVLARFEAERQALAMMDHPNIAKVFDAGSTEHGRPYFVMELCVGVSITEYCDAAQLTVRERLALFGQVCAALRHAHQKGIIHRDIKPGNVLVSDPDGRPVAKVIDFGIAKATDIRLTERTMFTAHRQMIGTPAYMSPEQAGGQLDVDTRSDIYSLGVLLYELLVGATPFDGRSLRSAGYGEMQRIIREVEPPTPSTRLSKTGDALASIAAARRSEPGALGSLVRGELDWIVMKALEKDRALRYATADALAADVERHLAGEPVLAAPPSRAYRARKFLRRHRRPVAVVGSLAALLVAGVVGTSLGLVWALRERARSDDAARIASLAAAGEAEARRAVEARAYLGDIEVAGLLHREGRFDLARRRLEACPERLRGWEWHWLDRSLDNSTRRLEGHTGSIAVARFSPDGSRIVTASNDGTARIWDRGSGRRVATLSGHGGAVTTAEFSPDGSRVLTGSVDGTAAIWDASSGRRLAHLTGHESMLTSARFDAEGTRVVTSSGDRTARIWDAVTSACLHVLAGHGERVNSAVFSPDGGAVITVSQDAVLRAWDPATGALLFARPGGMGILLTAEFAPGGQTLATTSLSRAPRIWSRATGDEYVALEDATVPEPVALFTPDGRHLVSGGVDGAIRVREVATGKIARTLVGHAERITALAVDASGRRLLSGSIDQSARVWDLERGTSTAELRGPAAAVGSVAMSPDGALALAAGDETARLFDPIARPNVVSSEGDGRSAAWSVLSPDGSRVATARWNDRVRIWDANSGAILLDRIEGTERAWRIAFAPDGVRLAVADRAGPARIVDATSGGLLVRLGPESERAYSVAFSPDGRRVLTTGLDGSAHLFDAESGAAILGPLRHDRPQVYAGTFSRDGRRIVTACSDGVARIWDAATGSLVASFAGGGGETCFAELSPDGTRLVSAGPFNVACVWDVATGKRLVHLRGHEHSIRTARFHPDGSRVVTASSDGTIRVWDAVTGDQLLELAVNPQPRSADMHTGSAEFSRDGTKLLGSVPGSAARIWDGTPRTGSGEPGARAAAEGTPLRVARVRVLDGIPRAAVARFMVQ